MSVGKDSRLEVRNRSKRNVNRKGPSKQIRKEEEDEVEMAEKKEKGNKQKE